jgi:transcriptional regulator with XRE-family HTH domain
MLRYFLLKVKHFFSFRRIRTDEIKALIKSRSLTQKDLAAELEYTPEYFNNVIHNRNNAKLNPQKAAVLAGVLGVSVSEISHLFGLRNKPSDLGDYGLEP